jgi:type I restriction enzyme S subunit
MFEWKRITLSDCLEQYRNTIFVNDDVEYGQITISNNNTIRFRGVKLGKTIGRKRQFLIDLKTHPNTVIFTRQGVADGSIGFAPKEVHGCITTENMPMFSVKNNVVAPELLGFFFKTFLFKQYVQSIETTGSAQKALHEKDLLQLPINIPSLLSNQQVVLKKLHASSVKIEALNVEFTTQQKHLKQLRQAILQEAIEGKLTAQWRAENPVIKGDLNTDAQALLAQIHAEKQSLITQGKLKKNKPLASIADDEKPFELPAGWVWVRLGEVCNKITDGFHNTPKKLEQTDFVYISATHVKDCIIDWANCDFVDEVSHRELFHKAYPQKGEILIVNIGAGCGVSAIIDVEYEFSFKNVAVLKFNQVFLINHFLQIYLRSQRDRIYLNLTQGGLQPFLSLKTLKDIFSPLPPIAEQSAIVTKVQHLLAQVDALETELKNRQVQTEQVCDAVW